MPAACLEALRARFGDRFSESAVREHHGRDESPYPVMAPDGVVFAHSTEEVAEIARLCNEHRVPLIPYGAGSRSKATSWRSRAASAWTCRR